MAARSIWRGAISFGMVSIPVKLYSATQNKDISFNLLHDECKSRIKQLRWCPVHERPLEMNELVRGYEYTKGQYVVLTDEDFEKLPLASKHTIELSAFVPGEAIDPVYYEKTYYLEPEEAGVKPYVLLMQALEKKGYRAIGKIALRNREQLCALRPGEGVLLVETLFYPDEIRVEQEQKLERVEVTERELEMAFSLIDLLAQPFEPEKYHDDYREALMRLIEAKLEGQEVEIPAAAPPKVMDLMEALRASVEAARKRREEPEEEAEETEKRPARRRRASVA